MKLLANRWLWRATLAAACILFVWGIVRQRGDNRADDMRGRAATPYTQDEKRQMANGEEPPR